MSLPREFLYGLHKNFSGDIRTDAATRILYSTDASMYQIQPLGVVIPRTQEELHAAVELAAKFKIPILPRGAGTSLAGQAIGEALILDCSRWLDSIIEVNSEERSAIVEPGVVLSDLNRAASKVGLMFGPDPASAERATMGGVIGNNATGAHSIVYGMSADHVLGADVILGDGTLATWGEILGDNSETGSKLGLQGRVLQAVSEIQRKYADAIKSNYPQTWRNAAGYRLNYLLPWSPSKPAGWEGSYPPVTNLNLAPLLAGSEGTLAVIRKIKVNLVPKPKFTVLAVVSYGSVADACDDVPRLLTHEPSAIELIPYMIIRAARQSAGYAREMGWTHGDPAALLVVEFSGNEHNSVMSRARGLRTPVGNRFLIAESREEQTRIWNVRKVGLGLMDSQPGSARPIAFMEDCAIPVERLGEFVREVERILFAHGTEGGMYAHASAGCLHIRPVLNLKTLRGVEKLRSISEAVLALTLSLGGAMSSEHGDGLARSEHLARTYGEEVMEAMRLLKDAADPGHILNPGKIVNSEKLDSNLRYGANYEARAWTPSLSFVREGGIELAVEQCNGQGVCRKTTGVMCPSFQATREEMHSTRGRANLLRELIQQPQKAASFTFDSVRNKLELEEATFQALDLCLACKGCKAECPSGVDMAKLKYEFENEYYKSHRRPLRDYVFGYFHVLAKMMAPIAPMTNWLMEFDHTRKLIARILGLAKERALPRIVQRGGMPNRGSVKLLRVGGATEAFAQSDKPKIIFLPDVFSQYVEPQVEAAAIEVLAMSGYEVSVLPIVGAGASLLSKGFVDAARRHARKTLELLNQLDPAREAFIVGVEPPEVYLLKNEYADLLPDQAKEIHKRATRVWLLDEFLLRSSEFNSLRVAKIVDKNGEDNKLQKLIFHPHCHQRAEGKAADGIASGSDASVELLRACGYEVVLSDAGCCGMAGTFGYEAEHYSLSMLIFEDAVAKGLAKGDWKVERGRLSTTNHDSEITSTGAACRMQVRHGLGTGARHPIEWVRDALN